MYQKNRRNQNDICPKSCLFTNLYFGPPVTGNNDPVRKDYAWAVLYFRRDIKTTREYVLYTLLSLAAEMGAFVGLLLGASLVDVGGIINQFFDQFKQKKVSHRYTKISVAYYNIAAVTLPSILK